MNIWHDISSDRIKPELFVAVIEISSGGKNKYELDKETGMLMLDRVLHTSTHYPANYGFIPRTLADDNDPLDVLVICQESIVPMTLVTCYPIGILKMTDGDSADEKIIAIPKNDPLFNEITDISQLSKHRFDEISHFFEVYKTLEHNAATAVTEVDDRAEALRVIEKSITAYHEIYSNRTS